MVTSNVFLYYLTIMFYFHSAQSLNDTGQPSNNTGHIGIVANFIDQIIAKNDSKLQEFLNIFQYYVNLTVIEKQRRKEIQKLTTVDSPDNETRKLGNEEDSAAINDLMKEENITADINDHIENVTDYIKSFVNKPENLKEKYIQSMQNYTNVEDEEGIANESMAADDFFYDSENSKENEFWDITETRRIFRGNSTKIKFFPFIASVHILNQFACAGSIISADLIITAASCLQLAWNNRFFRENPAFISVRVGSPYFSLGGEFISILEVYFHPDYVPKTLYNNLALMRLRFQLAFRRRKRNVKKIAIDRKASPLPMNTPGITIIGWGSKIEDNRITPVSSKLHMAVLDFYDLTSCRETYGKEYVTQKNFCAGFITKGTGACNHDVGDPGVSGRLLVGVASFGSPVCGKPDTPTVYTKIGYYADWIEEIMEQDVPHQKARTTTAQPLYQAEPPIILYGRHLRDKAANYDEQFSADDVQKIFDISESEEGMISPIVSRERLTQEPEILLDQTGLRAPQPSWHPEPQSNSEPDRDLRDNSDDDFKTKAATKIIGYDPNKSGEGNIHDVGPLPEYSESNHIRNTVETSKSSEIENVELRIPFESSDNNNNLQLSSEFSDNNDRGKSTSSETGAITEEDDIKIPYESLIKHDSSNIQKEIDLDSGPKDSKDKHNSFTASDERMEILEPSSNYNNLQRERNVAVPKQNKVRKHDKTRITEDDDYAEFIDAENNPEVGPKLTEFMLKKEIEKLIRQLEVSSELGPGADDDIVTDTPQDLQEPSVITDKGKGHLDKAHLEQVSSQEIEAEKDVQAIDSPNRETEPESGQSSSWSSEEGLSIDAVPFEKSMRGIDQYEFMRRKEIYDIFADVLRSVVNKTAKL